jgi:hypothetical protein
MGPARLRNAMTASTNSSHISVFSALLKVDQQIAYIRENGLRMTFRCLNINMKELESVWPWQLIDALEETTTAECIRIDRVIHHAVNR